MSVERGIHAGRAAERAVLPTIRALARDLQVSPATVAAAYRLLRTRGVIAGDGRRGTRVVSRRPTRWAPRGSALPAGAVDLATGDPDPALLPRLDEALRTLDLDTRGYGDEPYWRPLVAFASREFEADGIDARSVTVLSGALDAIERVLREHIRTGDRVAVEDPSYPGIRDLVTAGGFVPTPFAVDSEGPVPLAVNEALRHHCRALILTPRAQNPTGAALTRERAAELRRVLRRFPDTVLIENDYAAPVAGAPAVTLADASRAYWAVIRSTAKFLGPDLRVALMAADDLTTARVQGRQALGMRWVSHILQRLTLAVWSDPASGRRLARAADIYRQRRRALVAALGLHAITGSAPSGMHVWIPVADEAEAVSGLAARGWAVAAGERFRVHASPGIRVTISTLAPPATDRFAEDVSVVLRASGRAFA